MITSPKKSEFVAKSDLRTAPFFRGRGGRFGAAYDIQFKRYPRGEPDEVTPRKLAAARRAMQREKDRYPLFPELLTHQTAEERLEAIATSRAEW